MSEIKLRIAITRLLLILLFVPYDIRMGYQPIILVILVTPLNFLVEIIEPSSLDFESVKNIVVITFLVFPMLYFPILLIMNWWITNNETPKRLTTHRVFLFLSLVLVWFQATSVPLEIGYWLITAGITAAAYAELRIIKQEENNQ